MAPSYKYERGVSFVDTFEVEAPAPLVLAPRLEEFRLQVVVLGSLRLLRSFGMSSSSPM